MKKLSCFLMTGPLLLGAVGCIISERHIFPSEATNARIRGENEMADPKSETSSEKAPDFWPEHGAEPYPSPVDEAGRFLIAKRWESASTNSLGTKEDIASIRAVVIRHMKNPNATVDHIRWLSSYEVMISSGWYNGTAASADYTYVLKKGKDGWVILTYYMDGVS